jgi:hypothetical protein
MPRRALVVLGAAGAVAVILAVAASRSGGGGSTSSGVDWTAPTALPSPRLAEYRSEFLGDDEGYRFFPRSGRVVASEAYRFDTGHCGLGWLIDFDGSFWRAVDEASVPGRFLIDEDAGAIALVDFDRAVYRTSTGVEIGLERIQGPVVTQPCE